MAPDATAYPPDPAGITFRRPVEADYPAIIAVADDWWGGRHISRILPRLWLLHFTGTSWIAEAEDGRLAGFLIGFHSPDHPEVAYCHMIATNPNLRGRGLGRALYERFFADARAAGRSRAVAITWPANRTSVGFHRALGFELQGGPGSQNLYGVTAFDRYDYETEDRAVLVREL
jgi:GNAT superfamily N-acetyltransferase